jgi:hypothetical protein
MNAREVYEKYQTAVAKNASFGGPDGFFYARHEKQHLDRALAFVGEEASVEAFHAALSADVAACGECENGTYGN